MRQMLAAIAIEGGRCVVGDDDAAIGRVMHEQGDSRMFKQRAVPGLAARQLGVLALQAHHQERDAEREDNAQRDVQCRALLLVTTAQRAPIPEHRQHPRADDEQHRK